MNDSQKGKNSLFSRELAGKCLAVFLVGFALIMAYYYVHNFDDLRSTFSAINRILRPFYIGIIIAYLLSPVYNWTVRKAYKRLKGRFKRHRTGLKAARILASVVVLILIFVIVTGLIMLIIPGLYESVSALVPKLPAYFNSTIEMIESHLNNQSGASSYITENLGSWSDKIVSWAQEKLVPASEVLFSRISSGVIATIGGLLDCVIALIICVYILNSKELFIAQGKKFILAAFNEKHSRELFELGKLSDNVFGGFVNGKIIDSVIIGVLCFILMRILGLPMSMLISVIVGVTNIIPFFGPFIGAIPSTLIILLIDPLKALTFVIIIILLQQFDGNVIGPRILGSATGLSGFWVIVALVVGGGFFGLIGMLVGVPVLAIIYAWIKSRTEARLEKKGITSSTLDFQEIAYIDPFGNEPVKFSDLSGDEDESVLKPFEESEDASYAKDNWDEL